MINLYVEDGVIRCSKSGGGEEYVFQSLEIFQETDYITLSNNGQQKVYTHYSSLQVAGVSYGTAALTTDAIAALLATLVSGGGGGGGGTTFDGQLTQGGSDVSGANPLPVSGPVTDAQIRATSLPVVPLMTSSGNVSAQTNATGTNWTAFSSQTIKQLTLSNQSGTTIEIRQGGSGVGFQLPTTGICTFYGLTNANQLEIRRVDTSNTQVTITARWEA